MSEVERESMEFDVVIVGAGPAGLGDDGAGSGVALWAAQFNHALVSAGSLISSGRTRRLGFRHFGD